MTGENTYFIGEESVISIGTISLERALREVTVDKPPVADDSIMLGRSPSYNGDLSVDDISNNEISAVIIKNEDDLVTPCIRREDEDLSKSAMKRGTSLQLKKSNFALGGYSIGPQVNRVKKLKINVKFSLQAIDATNEFRYRSSKQKLLFRIAAKKGAPAVRAEDIARLVEMTNKS
jgi:hypothetical protein